MIAYIYELLAMLTGTINSTLSDKIEIKSADNTQPKFQSGQSVIINAPLDVVWDFSQDLSKIAGYHPRVSKVDLISGKQFRGNGVAYQCHLSDGKNTCTEKDIEVVLKERIVTVFVADTMGLTKLLPDYVVENTFKKIDEYSTKVDISHYYSGSKLKVFLLNPIIKRKIAGQTQDMLNASKKSIEDDFKNFIR